MSSGLSKKRFLVCTIRKQDVCKCGCKGNCSFGLIQRVLRWSYNALAEGVYPDRDHDENPLPEHRAVLRGFPLAGGWRAALCEIRADLLEVTGAYGFKTWQNPRNPCFACTVSKANLFNYTRTMAEIEWAPRDKHQYQTMLDNSLRKVQVPDPAALRRLIACLKMDPGAGGFVVRGRRNVEFDLPVGYRLIENAHVTDIHKVEAVETPAELHFFNAFNSQGLDQI
eukprot:4315026-Pyramimonas_sp.AAC.1